MANDDELAQTATAPKRSAQPEAAPRAMLGRFKLAGILGQGGMGIVYAAFDPELERKIALKVLRKAGDDDARARLLREARAMAKLSHPNVISVFEVGSADGDDFVAMELVDGETLGDWVRSARRDTRAIIAAFIAAGHGLAAAHGAGLVHRDFKPSNVLRSRTGKIVVTDFGLARTAEAQDGASSGEPAIARPLAMHTETGAILGTPAYMAPEQWTAGTMTAATDQFAFCVALWEALAEERPFAGATFHELRADVLAGSPRAMDKIPRPLRPILRRGLATDAAQRWPSMTALLAVLEPRGRGPWLAGGAVLLVAAIAVTAVLRSHEQADDCSPPALDPDRVWSAPRVVALAMRDPGAAKLVDSDVSAWRALRSRTCAEPPKDRTPKLACLDGTLARIDDAVGSALADSASVDTDGLAVELVDPVLCDRTTPPRLTPLTPELSAMFQLVRHARNGDAPLTAEELSRADRMSSPCARSVRNLERLGEHTWWNLGLGRRDIDSVRDVAAHCDDDQIRAEIAVRDADLESDPARADAAVARFPQADLRAAIAAIRARRARQASQWDLARAGSEQAIELYGIRHRTRAQVSQVVELSAVLLQLGRREDLDRFRELSRTWRPFARGTDRAELDKQGLQLRWHLGDLAAADAELDRLGVPPPSTLSAGTQLDSMIGVTGEVVDRSGAPVANATVISGEPLVGDAVTAGMQLYTTGRRSAHTGPDGRFSVGFAHGAIVAQSGTLRSRPTMVAPHVRLVLEPTTRIEGSVALGTTPASRIWVVAHGTLDAASQDVVVVAPVRADGSFHLDGLPRGRLVIGAVDSGGLGVGSRPQQVMVDGEHLSGITLALTPPLYVIGRSTDLSAPESAMLWIFSKFDPVPHPKLSSLLGRMGGSADTVKFVTAQKLDLDHVAPELAGRVQADDVVALIPDRPEGETVLCGIGFARKQIASANAGLTAIGSAVLDEQLACIHVDATQSVVTLALPPLRKLEAK
ncbi:MAG: Serine/threonine protein kinase [Myxococcales bacterium]|nr:Serine/threonine protein kinase [Myxococcales bacterium]